MDELLHRFLVDALEPREGQRKGQAFMNALIRHNPSLLERLQRDRPDLDAFYVDDRMWATLVWVKENW